MKQLFITRIILIGLFGLIGTATARASAPARIISQFQHTAWGLKEGAPSGIRSLAQSREGYLWIGTADGLYRFDGVRFEHYESQLGDPLPAGDVEALFSLQNGDVWIGFASGEISVLREGAIKNYSPIGISGSVTGFAQDRAGTLWAGTRGGLLRLEGDEWRIIGKAWDYPMTPVFSIFVDSHGTLWVGAKDALLYLPATAKLFRSAGIKLDEAAQFAEAPSGKLWVAETARYVRPVPLDDGSPPRDETQIQVGSEGILFDRDGALWVTTLGDGVRRAVSVEHLHGKLGRFDPAVEIFDAKSGLTDDVSEPIIEDREGNIWVGTNSGLDRFSKFRLVPVTAPIGHYNPVLVAGDAGGVQICDEDTLFFIDGFSTRSVKASMGHCDFGFHEPNRSTWWVGEYGVYRVHDAHVSSYRIPTEVGGHPANGMVITEDGSGELWAAIQQLGFYRFTDGLWNRFETPQELRRLQPQAAFTDSTGRMWFGYVGGTVAIVENGKASSLGDSQLARVGVIGGRAPHVWVGGETGLALADQGHFRQMLPAGLPSFMAVSGIEETAGGDLWLAERQGVVHVPATEVREFLKSSVHKVHYEVFDFRDGLPGTFLGIHVGDAPRATQGTDGRLWFLASKGLAWIDPEHIDRNAVVPPVVIESLVADGRQYATAKELSLPGGTMNLQISYTALSFTVPERVRFRYMLTGIDKDWQDPGRRREAFYTNLRPGQYRFRVIACNNDGVWNMDGASFLFQVRPLFYQTGFFALLCATFAALMGWLLYLARIRQLSRQMNARLEATLEARIEERTQIARDLHDSLLQGFQGLMFRLQAVRQLLPDGASTAVASLDDALDKGDQAISEAREAVRGLRRPAVQTGDLAQALTAIAAELTSSASSNETQARVSINGEPRSISAMVRDEIYAIARESLRNAIQHAHAAEVKTLLTFGPTVFTLSVQDDGVGIAPEVIARGVRPDHFGLPGMRERANRIGGQLLIRSALGHGTEVELTIPGRVAYSAESNAIE